MLTKKDLMAAIPCEEYTAEFVDKIFEGKSGSLQDILDAPVDITDKIWILLREPFLRPEQLLKLAKQFYKDVENFNTLRAQYYKRMTLAASKGDFIGDHFYKLETDYVDKWRAATSIETQIAIQTGIWSALTCNAQAKALEIERKEKEKILYSHRQSQLQHIINTIKEE